MLQILRYIVDKAAAIFLISKTSIFIKLMFREEKMVYNNDDNNNNNNNNNNHKRLHIPVGREKIIL
jgi:hypothetical protein